MANSTYLLRLELINPDGNDYDLLHAEMAAISFYRVIESTHWLDLPTGSYARSTSNTLTVTQDANETENLVSKTIFEFIAQKPLNDNGLPKDYIYFLSKFEYGGYKLHYNTDPSKLPS
ncbi:MAG TPA: hypothetical protein VK668_08820 [Mucilaginibacter sp.]|nr:hypothetical protein [Mucilaginibacter sp.]